MTLVGHGDFLRLSQAILESGNSLRFRARGWSMHPFIQDGDLLTIAPVGKGSVKRGDVVLYATDENRLMVHRVISPSKKSDVMMLIKGDSCLGSPERVTPREVLGKLILIEREGTKRHIDSKAYRMVGLAFAILSPVRWFIFSSGSKLKRKAHSILGF
jgi:signal peptidase I